MLPLYNYTHSPCVQIGVTIDCRTKERLDFIFLVNQRWSSERKDISNFFFALNIALNGTWFCRTFQRKSDINPLWIPFIAQMCLWGNFQKRQNAIVAAWLTELGIVRCCFKMLLCSKSHVDDFAVLWSCKVDFCDACSFAFEWMFSCCVWWC